MANFKYCQCFLQMSIVCGMIPYYSQFQFQMQSNKRFKGDFIIPTSQVQFRHKHLSLGKQRKDKDIKKKREQLQKKRIEFEEAKGKWAKEEMQFNIYSAKRREENIDLIRTEQKLKIDLFRWAIRKDQIESKIHPEITIQKANILKKYLRCVGFTAGKRLESIQFWKSESRYNKLKFLLEIALDRFFGRSAVQKKIISNLSRIVFCKKVKFENQWIMVCIKEPEESSINYCTKTCKKSHRSIYHPQSMNRNKSFELFIYAITGKYFHISKNYSQMQLRQWADSENLQNYKPVLNLKRLSVADNLAKLNVLKQLSENSSMGPQIFNENLNKQSSNSFNQDIKIISEQKVHCSQVSESNGQFERNSTVQQLSTDLDNRNINQQKSQSSKNQTEDNLSDLNESQSENFKIRTRKSMHQKSSFFIQGNNQSKICKFNRQFMQGTEEIFFPQQSPISNLIILKEKSQIYLFQEYIKCPNKKLILDKTIARFKLKMKIRAEHKKCLYYKIIKVTSCYQTVMAEQECISLPCLFVLKSHSTPDTHQIHISCDSLVSHPKIENGLQIKGVLHQIFKQKEQTKDSRLFGRNSNIKNGSKNGGQRRSRESKRRHNTRNLSRHLAIEHEKSGYSLVKKTIQPWVAFSPQVIAKFEEFMEGHLISILKRSFVKRQWIKNRIFGIIRIQNKIRSIISKQRLKSVKQSSKFKCAWRPQIKFLATAILNIKQKNVRVYFQIVETGASELVKCITYDQQNWQAICNSLETTQHIGSFEEVCDHLIKTIEENIDIQTNKRMQIEREKPQKYRKMIKNFFFMVNLRNKAKKNIFFIKKVVIKDRIFVLLIRRDKHVRSLLECNLYDLILQKGKQDSKDAKESDTAFSKEKELVSSEYGYNKTPSRSKPDLDNKIYRYQKIYLMQKYFQNIDPKRIAEQFFIEKEVFLLKPPRTSGVYYIQRLGSLDLNSQDFSRQFGVYERQQNVLLKFNEQRKFLNVSNHSIKKLINQNNSQKNETIHVQSKELLNLSRMKVRKQSKQRSRKDKKTSIENNQRQIMTFLKSNFVKEHLQNSQNASKKSFGQSFKARQVYKIKGNSHESTVYYSLYKEQNVFFYLEFFIVKRTSRQNTYRQQLVSIEKFRLYKKQLQQAYSCLFYKKLAAWAHQNQDQFLRSQESSKEKQDYQYFKDEQVSNLNLVTLDILNALMGANKRLSCNHDIQNSSVTQKGSRTNTINF